MNLNNMSNNKGCSLDLNKHISLDLGKFSDLKVVRLGLGWKAGKMVKILILMFLLCLLLSFSSLESSLFNALEFFIEKCSHYSVFNSFSAEGSSIYP